MNKEIKIEIPEGYEIDKDNSIPFEKIVFKKIYPSKVSDIKHKRSFFIDGAGYVHETKIGPYTKNHLISRERAKAFLALMQLVELRDAWNKIDEFQLQFIDSLDVKYCIVNHEGKLHKDCTSLTNKVLSFGNKNTRDLFLEKFKDLIETAKELI